MSLATKRPAPQAPSARAGKKSKPKKAAKGKSKGQSLLDDVPMALPALTRALKPQKRAATVGFDWPSTANVLDKLNEEMLELSRRLCKRR